MTSSEKKRTKVFVSYSHEDTLWLNRLKVHMKPLIREGLVDFWDDTKIQPGMDWRSSIRAAIDSANVAILLISADFLASEFIVSNELLPLLEAAEKEGALILPIILSPSLFIDTPSLNRFQSLNPPDRPLIKMEKWEQEEVFVKAANEIMEAEERLRTEAESRAEEARHKAAEEEKRKSEEDAKQKAEEAERRRAEELKRNADEVRKRQEEAAKAKQEMPSAAKVSSRSYMPWLAGGAVIIILAGMYLYEQGKKGGPQETATPQIVQKEPVPKATTPLQEAPVVTEKRPEPAKPKLSEKPPVEKPQPIVSGEKKAAPAAQKGSELWKDPITGMEFVLVRGDCFEMGDTFGDGDKIAKPIHTVCVDDYYIGKYEVTQEQWQKVMGSNPSRLKGCDDCPVEKVSWDDAQAFIEKLNSQTGKRFRLPTEAEWEFAARSGGKKEKWAGTSDKSSLGEYDWFKGNSGYKIHPVGQLRPNGLGLYDMSGNVWEWVNDRAYEKYYGISPKKNPEGPRVGTFRVLRGGSFNDTHQDTRCDCRNYTSPDARNDGFGFRCVRTP